MCLAGFRWLGGQSLEDFHSGLSLLVCLWPGTVGVGLDLHIEDLVFSSSDHAVVIPVDECKKLLEVDPILIPGFLIGPFLWCRGTVFFGIGFRLSSEHLVGQFLLPTQTAIAIAIGALPIRVRELVVLPNVVAILIESGPHLPRFGQLLFAEGGLHFRHVRVRVFVSA